MVECTEFCVRCVRLEAELEREAESIGYTVRAGPR